MVTYEKQSQQIDGIGTVTATFYGLHDDSKPTSGVGNSTNDNNHSNARTLDWEGNE